ncbi:GNAT family N-acyltransferase [Gordonia sp. CPCC 205515]|uniref:GNAT family N-acetyltransferase n=1 Tax=Gordonia sp. CPCC 205515 TaxID=3140791 RepID=UPI003AF3382D
MTVTIATRPRTILDTGALTVEISDDPADIDAVQRLRYRVFAAEPGFSDAIGDAATGLDADRFDEFCDHLIVRHHEDGVIGCARLLRSARAVDAGGWYTATEFDIGGLREILSATVEMGRVCVAAGHRQGSTTALMWAALLQYLDDGDHQYLMGCVSVPLSGIGARGSGLRGVRDTLRDKHSAPWPVYPHHRPQVDGQLLDDIEPPGAVNLPPLLRAYLRLGARVCGEPAIDEIFDVGDFVTIIDHASGNTRYLDRLRSAATRLAPASTV